MAKRRWFFRVRVLLSLTLLAYLILQIDLQSLLAQYREIYVPFVLVAMGILILQQVLSTLKWMVILKTDGIKLPFGFLLRTYFVASFISLFLPTSFGGDLYRIYRLNGISNDSAKSISSVLFDRLSGVFALGSTALIATVFLPDNPYQQVILLLYLMGILIFLGLTTEWASQRIGKLHLTPFQVLFKVLHSFRKYCNLPGYFTVILLISFWFHLNIVLINYLYASALHIEIQFTMLLVIIPLIYLTETIPLSINGLGIRDGAFVFFFTLVGNTAQEGLAVSLLIVVIRYIIGLIGGVLLLNDQIRWRRKDESLLPASTEPTERSQFLSHSNGIADE